MPGWTVECLNIDGRWSPKDGVHKLQSLFSAAFETFEARLQGRRSRIVEWPGNKIVATVPPRAVHVTPKDVHGIIGALRKLWGES